LVDAFAVPGGGSELSRLSISEGPGVRAAAQDLSEGRDRRRETETVARRRQLGLDVVALEGALDEMTRGVDTFLRLLVGQAQERDLAALLVDRAGVTVAQRLDALAAGASQRDLVERRDAMPRADLARVDGVVVEVLALEHAVLVADQPVLADHRRVELDLD